MKQTTILVVSCVSAAAIAWTAGWSRGGPPVEREIPSAPQGQIEAGQEWTSRQIAATVQNISLPGAVITKSVTRSTNALDSGEKPCLYRSLPPGVEDFVSQIAPPDTGQDVETSQLFRQRIQDVLDRRNSLSLMRRTVTELPDGSAGIFDFAPDENSSAALTEDLRNAFRVLTGIDADSAVTAWGDFAEGDPSLDLSQNHRRITIQKNGAGAGWQVVDETLSPSGEQTARTTLFLSLDEDDQFVWPGEFAALLSL